MVEDEDFEMFIRSYQNMVFSVSARIVGNLADAEDITYVVRLNPSPDRSATPPSSSGPTATPPQTM